MMAITTRSSINVKAWRDPDGDSARMGTVLLCPARPPGRFPGWEPVAGGGLGPVGLRVDQDAGVRRLRQDGQADHELAAAVGPFAVGLNGPPVHLDHLTHERQADAEPALRPVDRPI